MQVLLEVIAWGTIVFAIGYTWSGGKFKGFVWLQTLIVCLFSSLGIAFTERTTSGILYLGYHVVKAITPWW